MFVCPTHEIVLLEKNDRIYCPVCSFSGIQETDGMWNFSSEQEASSADTYYDPKGFVTLRDHEKKHFWFVSRIKRIKRLCDQYLPKAGHLLEIGAGTCEVAFALKQVGYCVSVSDVHKESLVTATQRGFHDRYCFDLLNNPLREAFDAVGMFDVLEHIKQDDDALENVYKILKPGGIFLLTVPAHAWLWNKDDELAYHKRRYTENGLRELVAKSGFVILDANYFFRSLIPFLILRALLSRVPTDKQLQNKTPKGIFVHPQINRILTAILSLEERYTSSLRIPFGGSLWLVAKKPNQSI